MAQRLASPSLSGFARRSSGLVVPRRAVLAGAGAAGAMGVLAACGGDEESSGSASGGAAASGSTSLGSNRGDEVPRAAEDEMIAAFEEESGITVETNVVDNESFQESINSYLQGNPQDVFTWFAGFRARFFDDQGFIGDISDVWEDIGSGFTDAFREASSNGDRQIFVPLYNYPWAVFYRKSVFEENGWAIPETLDDFVALCEEIQGAGLTPVALGDQDGWPAMGTFDILNMRINGYDYHIDLMAGNQDWDSGEVRAVFEQWAELLPYHQADPNGRTWQDAAASLVQGESAMYVLGMFVGEQFPEEEREDLDFFTFPEIDPEIGSGALDAPIDGYMMTANPENEEAAKEFLRFLGSAQAGEIFVASSPNSIAAHSDADTSGYNSLQQKAVDLISNADGIAQFLDRDTRPDFASTIVIPTLQNFLNDPSDIDTVLADLQAGKERLFVDQG
ncbi:ABC transporter substrate-binding protein [Aquipuribacter nitratireducens]|uniref:ABC transporter substrate-binding protein n=1 Tax=Aquipuribacter nitratireducens TaxID=650104 RepID=A0ABW0GJU7_9MICO